MAPKAKTLYSCSDKDTLYVRRFVYDVMMYTLKKCGFPETKLPSTDCKENVYNRPYSVKIAGASALRIALIMREKWRQMFVSRRNISEFGDKEIRLFLGQLVICCSLSRARIKQSVVELFLASFNEMALFLHHENIVFNFNKAIKYISSYIIFAIQPLKNGPEIIEELFDEFENILGYTRWITNFIKKYAVPYGSRDDVSDLFLERVKKQSKDEMKKMTRSGTPIKKLKDILGFLPQDIFSAILSEEFALFVEILKPAMRPIYDRESPEAPKSLNDSESVAVEKRKSPRRRSTRSDSASEHTVQSEANKNFSELGLEDDLGQMNLAAEDASQEVHGAIPKKKNVQKEKQKSIRKGISSVFPHF
ncbi:hypothetical protein HNY73_018541 [Argiope bruennichi]|uniref:Uncharacterized protein n=1 Tax=Argiope bruennichi TaxID=94029 RepID=A0A8T0EEE5_ARGBR|nr:hypothetical protein HNY73_018541 [Argiope bruennichi]